MVGLERARFCQSLHRHLSDDVFRWKIHDKFGVVPDAMYVDPLASYL